MPIHMRLSAVNPTPHSGISPYLEGHHRRVVARSYAPGTLLASKPLSSPSEHLASSSLSLYTPTSLDMLTRFATSACVLALASYSRGSPTNPPSTSNGKSSSTSPSPQAINSVQLNGVTYVNKGLVGFGRIPSDFVESTGDTLGGIGSAIDLKYGTFKPASNGKFTGTFIVSPDRGYNVDSTIDYQSRHHEIDFVLTPYYGSANLTYDDAAQTLNLTYRKTVLNWDRKHVKTSGLSPVAVRPAEFGYPLLAIADPQMPIASNAEPHLTIDAEGLVHLPDGSFWLSDEYGPYIYRFAADGTLIQTIQPPNAFLPRDAQGNLNFTSDVTLATGRVGNQGFENLSLDRKNNILYAMLQSATLQDGGTDKTTSRYTRMVAYDVNFPLLIHPRLVGEWVVPLPQDSKGKTLASSDIHFISPGVFLALARDGNGHGDTTDSSKYKHADLFTIKGATDIHGSKFDDPAHPVSPNGVLDASITPATYVSFINYLNTTELARFGLHNGDPDDRTDIDAKWESFALASVNDKEYPNDYFLFTASDNDFMSTHGISLGVPFDAGEDVDNQFMVFRVTLPGASL
ncbi:hypothetical protein H0H93_003765 [Arthromyces matolae]|nr:hypothetical protein H0H93_003765 [Arthromyces matolae]